MFLPVGVGDERCSRNKSYSDSVGIQYIGGSRDSQKSSHEDDNRLIEHDNSISAGRSNFKIVLQLIEHDNSVSAGDIGRSYFKILLFGTKFLPHLGSVGVGDERCSRNRSHSDSIGIQYIGGSRDSQKSSYEDDKRLIERDNSVSAGLSAGRSDFKDARETEAIRTQ
ncbi:hypothetical protein M5689_008123 [Euphorbia peplus]|nr:hypothetical protein M5689_008123 [Euphorbia peplus]